MSFISAPTQPAPLTALLPVSAQAAPLSRPHRRPAVGAPPVPALGRPRVVAPALPRLPRGLAVRAGAAAVQTDLKRILAYSSIAHAGYILIGFQVATPRGREAALLYLFVYSFMTIGAFAVITVAAKRGDDQHSLDDYRGLALERPVVG